MASITLKDLPETFLDRLRCRAEEERRSLSQQMIYMLEKALDNPEPESRQPAGRVSEISLYKYVYDRKEMIQKALDAVGRFESGISDTSEEHDGYFAESTDQ